MATVTLTATFTAAGPFTWTCPAGVTSVVVACTGAGGGGGAAKLASGAQGGGGGGGEAALNAAVAVTPGLAYTGTTGAGGAAGTSGGDGTAGGDTSFTGDGTVMVYAHGGTQGTAGTAAGAGQNGTGGTGSTAPVSAAGGDGDDGTPAANGGGGGSAAGSGVLAAVPGNAASGATAGAATGGTYPGGAGGAGNSTGTGTGGAGSAPGGGGGGALSTGTARAGGAGAGGQVVITWTQADPVTLSAGTAGGAYAFTAPVGASSVTAQAWGAGGGGFNNAAAGTTARAGSTVWQVYGITNKSQRVAVANIFDGYVGVPMALQAQKVYYNETGGDSIASYADVNTPQPVGLLAAAGCQIVLCPKANRSYATGTDDFTALQSAVADIVSHIGAASLTVVLWQECTDNWFPSAAAYLAYWNHYAPAIPGNVLLAVDVGAGPGLAADQAYVQAVMGSAVRKPDVIAVDVYDSSYSHGRNYLTYPPGDPNYPGVADMADTLGVPFGIYEYGQSASAGYTETAANWHDYIYGTHGLLTVIKARIAAGAPMHHVMYYGGAGPGNNDINSSTDFRVPALNDIYNTVMGAQAVGGAGGGGGEFAQETSLAVTGSHSYALSVGAGAVLLTGGNSAIAGDSVTVTAHGGAAATVQAAGGAGGTGSANTTHFAGGAGGAGGIAAGGGGGGGGSGGTAAAGNAGAAGTQNFGGAGGAAVTGGGQGGFGAKPGVSGFPGQSPGGGGGGGGAAAVAVGAGSDGQITLSGFTTHPGGSGALGLAPLALSAACFTGSSSGALALAGPALSGTGNVSMFAFTQRGTTAAGSPTLTLTLSAGSKAGSLLTATVAQSPQSASVPPAGWALTGAQNTGGATGRIERWYLPPNLNPGGITSVNFTVGTAGRGFMDEFAPPPGFTAVLDGTPGTASGTTGATSFPVSTGSSSAAGDLALVSFEDQFSVVPAGQTWTFPPGWATEVQIPNVFDSYASYYKTGLNSGTQSVTGTTSTSVNQVGWAALLCVFTAVPLNTSAGSMALAPLGLSGTGNAVVGAGQVTASGALALAPLGFQSPSLAATFPGAPLPVMAEILINGTWTDISSYLYQRDSIVISGRGRPDEASSVQPAQCALTLSNRDGSFSPQNAAGQFYPYLLRNTQIRISVVNAVTPLGAWYSGYRFWGEVPAWPVQWDLSGNDVYVPITAAGVLQRMRQSKYSASPLTRYYTGLTTRALAQGLPAGGLPPAGYWPCEDGTAAASFASGIPGGSPMTWTGTPGLAADSSAPGSAPFAQLNSSAWTGTPGAFSQGGQTFTAAGTFTWTCPAGITSIKAECWGAGGGGANGQFGPGGAGGEYAAEPALAVTPGKSYTMTIGAGGSGGPGSFSARGTAGSNGADSAFSGDTATVRAHGGKGAPSSSSGHANGGSGSTNTTHHNGGNGASSANHFGGCGGGSSGGSAAAGNTGNSSSGTPGGAGGNAVPDGGGGGAGGAGATAAQGNVAAPGFMPVPGPGGGGGGGGFGSFNNYGKPGGGGAPGQIRISFGATTPAPPAVVLRGVIDVPAAGGIDGSYMLQAFTSGTVADLHVKYHTGGNLELRGNNGAGGQLFSTGSKSFSANGQPLLVSAELTQKTATTIAWKLTAITPGAAAVVATFTGTVTGTLGSVTSVKTNSTAPVDTGPTGVGHISVQYAVDPVLNLAPAFAAYSGELAAARFLRLCAEQNVPAVLTGTAADTPQMGAQPAGLLADLLQDCESADLGQMYELRDAFGLGYRTRVSLQNQAPAVVLDYSRAQLPPPLTPTNDDQLTRNDIIVTRAGGGTSYEAIQSAGALSVQDPPNGVGLYQYTVSPNLVSDAQIAQFAAWLLTLGTLDEFRYPQITVNLVKPSVADVTFTNMAALDIGDFLQIVNPPAWLPPMPINQLAFGISETLGSKYWTIVVNAVPEDPYGSGGAGSPPPAW